MHCSRFMCIIVYLYQRFYFMKKLPIALLFILVLLSSFGLKERVIKSNRKSFAHVPYDVVIVPGYPYDTAPKFPLLAARMNWVKELYEKGITKNIIFSGGAIHTPYVEAKVMKIIADTLGIPSNHIFLEEHAPHSFQNITYSNKLAKKLGFKKVAVATDPFQFSYMSLMIGAAPGVRILTFSPDSSEAKKYFQPLPYYDPRDAFVNDFVPLENR